ELRDIVPFRRRCGRVWERLGPRAAPGRNRQPEPLGTDDRLLAEQRNALHDVLELAHVAGPGILAQQPARIVAEPLGAEAGLRAGSPEETLGQEEDVVSTSPESWKPEGRSEERRVGKEGGSRRVRV